MRRKRTIPARLTQNTYNGKSIGVTNAPTRLEAEGCWGMGEITSAIKNGTAALEETSTWPPNHLIVEYLVVGGGGGGAIGSDTSRLAAMAAARSPEDPLLQRPASLSTPPSPPSRMT